jgi:hypothetical protein
MKDGLDDMVELVMTANWEATQRGVLPQWTIYRRPEEWPEGYIARLHEVSKAGVAPTKRTLKGSHDIEALQLLRHIFTCARLVCFPRSDSDHPTIVETWT